VDDALNATVRVEEGISPAGVALLRSIKALENLKVENHDQKTGRHRRKAIQAPARQIVDNAGADGPWWSASCSKPRNITSAMMHRPESMAPGQARIIDPTKSSVRPFRTRVDRGLIVTTRRRSPNIEDGSSGMPAAAWRYDY